MEGAMDGQSDHRMRGYYFDPGRSLDEPVRMSDDRLKHIRLLALFETNRNGWTDDEG